MGQYIAKRLLFSIPVVIAASIIVFAAVRLVPGDICQIVLKVPYPAEAECARLKDRLGFDEPVVTQYFTWAGNILTGDFGESLLNGRPVAKDIQQRLMTTLELTSVAVAFSIAIAIPIGVYAALNQDKAPDVLMRGVTIGWLSMPSFWIGTMLITFPAKWWGYSQPVGYAHLWQDPLKSLEQLYLPAIALGLALCATLARLIRSSMLEVLRQDYMRTAKAKGLAVRTMMFRHALKNAMLPVISLVGIQLGFVLGGTVVLESLFSLPGLGTLLLTSVLAKDFTMIQGLVLVFALLIVFINLVIDLSYGWFDPRVRYT